MLTSFLTDASESSSAAVSLRVSPDEVSGREFIRILVIGSRRGVMRVIHTLHSLGFAEVGEWSPLIPYGDAGEMMSILRRQIFLG
ncbi:MAG: hypothetical protein VKL59_10720 [Nostocaceae cyanobacterium]|nr:hypothetical protein [Nostocaceae cyanobacterium]